jgi:hypothetical protein
LWVHPIYFHPMTIQKPKKKAQKDEALLKEYKGKNVEG